MTELVEVPPKSPEFAPEIVVKSTNPSLMGPMVGTSFSIVTVAPASITTLSPSKSVATNTEARLSAIVSASPPPVASGTWSTWSSSVNVNASSAVPSIVSFPPSAPA